MKKAMNTGEVSVFLCVLFCIPGCLYACVYSCGLKEKKEGKSVPRERCGLCPAAFGTKGLLLLCMLVVSVRDKVWSWEIRSHSANETHAKGLYGNLPFQLLIFYFEAFHSLPDITSISSAPPVFAFIWIAWLAAFNHIRSFTCNHNLQHLLEWHLKSSKDV